MANENENSDNFDLGLDVEIGPGANLFEQFHKAKSDPPADPPPADDPADDDEPADDKKKSTGTPPPVDPKNTPPVDPKKDEEVKFKIDPDKLHELILKKDTDDPADDPEPNADPADPKKQKPPAAPKHVAEFAAIYDHLVNELGYTALPDGEAIDSEEKFIEWQQNNDNERATEIASEMINSAFEKQKDMLPLAQDFFRALQNGVGIQEFLETRRNDDITAEYLTTEDAEIKTERAKQVLNRYYTALNWDAATIEKTIKSLDAGGQLETMAETTLPQFIKMKEQRKTQAEAIALSNKTKSEQQVREYNTELFKVIDETKEFLSFNIANPKDKQKLKEYMFSPTVELEDGRKVPQYVIDQQKARLNPKYTLLNALTLMNKGLDVANLKEKASQSEKQTLKQKLELAAKGKKIEQPPSESTSKEKAPLKNVLDFDKIEFA